MAKTIAAAPRNGQTKSDKRKMREAGKVPGVVYGEKINTCIMVDEKELRQLLKTSRRPVVTLDIPGVGKQPAMVTETQRDAINRHLLHVDFHQIRLDQKVKTVVRIDFQGEAAGEQDGGIFQPIRAELEIKCYPDRIPDALICKIGHMAIGDTLTVVDIIVPGDVEVVTDQDEVVATVLFPQRTEEDDIAAEMTEDKATGAAGEENVQEAEAVKS